MALYDDMTRAPMLADPGLAMAGQAAANLTNLRQRRPVVSPMRAYQQSVLQEHRMNLLNRQQQEEQRRYEEGKAASARQRQQDLLKWVAEGSATNELGDQSIAALAAAGTSGR